MKRFCSLVLALLLALNAPVMAAAGAETGSPDPADGAGAVTRSELFSLPHEPVSADNFLPAGDKWKACTDGEQPATFSSSKITCVLADGVIRADNIAGSVADMGQLLSGGAQKLSPGRIAAQGGYIPKAVLDTAAGGAPKNGAVIVDLAQGTAFKISSETSYSGVFAADPKLSELVAPLRGTYSVTRPQLHEIVKDFTLEEDTVQLNRANITAFAPGVEAAVSVPSAVGTVSESDKRFKTLTGNNLIELDFHDATVLQGKVGSSTIYVQVSGGIAIDAIGVTGRYSCNSGYELSMTMRQECYLVAMLDAEISEEIRVPILGITIPFGIGQVYGGIFAVISMDGSIRLDLEARETTGCRMGVRGGTFLYAPVSFVPIFEPEPPKLSGDCGLNGKINGSLRFGPLLGLELFGFDLVGAGVLLGAGVNVNSDGALMDVELYGCIDVYVTLADKRFTLARARPTIYKKKQPDLHGYRVSFLETYINPGRVGGLIEEEPAASGGAYLPASGLEYRIWVVPGNMTGTFTVSNRETLLAKTPSDPSAPADRLRTYPASGFSRINSEGEFYELDPGICYEGDQVWLEFIGKPESGSQSAGQRFFVGPVTPTLPFTDVTIISTDLFNDFITGKVEPKSLIRWSADRFDPEQEQRELTYYQGPVYISPFNDYGLTGNKTHPSYTVCGTARTDTNSRGEFDTRIGYLDTDGTLREPGEIDVLDTETETYTFYENGEQKTGIRYPPAWIGILVSLQTNGAVMNRTFYGITPEQPQFQVSRILDYVENSAQKQVSGGAIVDRMQFDETICITNPGGTRTVTADLLGYSVSAFSTQDFPTGKTGPATAVRSGPLSLTPVLDEDGGPTGSVLLRQRVTLEWVWQPHPNPIRITSAAAASAEAGRESVFQASAEGFLPRYLLEGAPQRVWIDGETGLLHIPATLSPGSYSFVLQASEGIALTTVNGLDPKRGNDSSPPDRQTFTLTVTGSAATPEPSVTPTPTPTPVPSSAPEAKAPVILEDEYNTYLTMTRGTDLSIAFTASGSTPIVWSLLPPDGGSLPDGLSIDPASGLLTASGTLVPGSHRILVQAENSAGTDRHECTLVMPAPEPPLLANRRDGYQFTMSRANTGYSVQLAASGSTPVTWSLEAVNERLPVPSEITIDASSGLVHVKGGLIGGIAAGVYDFKVRASNEAGTDARNCKLTVTSSQIPQFAAVLAAAAGTNDNAVPLLGSSAGIQPSGSAVPAALMTVRCDDPRDVYTRDRETVNGALFLHWNTRIEITLARVRHVSYATGTSLDGQSTELRQDALALEDSAPVGDRYHYAAPSALLPGDAGSFTADERGEIKARMEALIAAKISAYRSGFLTIAAPAAGSLTAETDDRSVSPLDAVSSGLDCRALAERIGAGGSQEVTLDAGTGTTVSGSLFTALAGANGAVLTFRQPGAAIAFYSGETAAADEQALFNLGFTGARHEQAMMAAAGSGSQSFAFGFQHHGALPGTAVFSIDTGLTPGTVVSVYRLDAGNATYSLIAAGRTVAADGVVTYRNDTMSEYLITSGTIAGAAVSAMSGRQDGSPAAVPGLLLAAAGILPAAALILWAVRRRRAKFRR